MTRVLVTGSAGFIAPHIVEQCLKMDWKVLCVDILDVDHKIRSTKVEYVKKDLRNLSKGELKSVDYIAHMAFVTNIPNSIKNPIDTTRNNIEMTARLLKLATDANVKKFLFPSTASLYGHNPIPWKEDMSADPIEPYSWQKLSCENLCKMWTVRYGVPTTTLRLYQVYGENQRKDTALAAFIKKKKNNEFITLTETTAQSSFKSGRRDFIYVKDVAAAFIAAMISKKTGYGEIINIGTGVMTSMEEIARVIGGKIKFIPKRNFEVECHQADMKLCKELLDWKPKVSILPWLKNFCNNIK